MRGATPRKTLAVCIYNISIHAPYARSDLISMSVPPSTSFQSTLLMRGATKEAWRDLLSIMISIHAPHARSDRALSEHRGLHHQISIHAPHARSDSSSTSTPTACTNFNPRSSCEERRADSSGLRKELGISIHAPHARSDNSKQAHVRFIDKISIHAPHARSD